MFSAAMGMNASWSAVVDMLRLATMVSTGQRDYLP